MKTHLISEIELIYRPQKYESETIQSSNDAEAIFRKFWDENTIEYYEEFKVMYLNRRNEVLGIYHHCKGGLAGVVCDLRMIYQAALKSNAHAIILAHNHPSGNLQPSKIDLDLTKKIKAAGVFLEIPVLDHLILTKESYLSMVSEGVF